MIVIPNINDHLPLDKAELIAFFLETLLYGVSVLLFIITIWVLIYHRRTERVNKSLVVTSCVMMTFGTLHLAIDLSRILEGFIDQRDSPGGPVGYFAQLFLWSHVVKTLFFALQTVLADSFATYRCYVVWRRPFAALIPGSFVCGTLATSMTVVARLAKLKPGEDVFAGPLMGWITSFFTMTLCTNVLCTSLIAFRIWYSTRKLERYAGRQAQTLWPVVIVIIESGAIYSLSCLTLLISYILGSNAQYPALDGTFPIISLVFNLIIVRIGLGIAHGGASSLHNTKPTSEITGPNFEITSGAHTQYPLKPLSVTVTQLVHQEGDHVQKDQESINSEAKSKWDSV